MKSLSMKNHNVNNADILLGPALCGTLVAASAERVIDAYRDCFDFRVLADQPISAAHASAWGLPALSGKRMVWLAPATGEACALRVIEIPDCLPAEPLRRNGWMALEISVQDVDQVAARLRGKDCPFSIIGEPAFLEISDQIKAMQVIGPAGEVLYLTEVRAPVPPFDLPLAPANLVDRLFIPVLSCADRDAALAPYAALAGRDGLRFATKVTVLNRAFGRDISSQYPVAVLQLAGASLIEIDQVESASPLLKNSVGLPSGIAMVSFIVDHAQLTTTSANADHAQVVDAPGYHHQCVLLQRGSAGEIAELIASLPACQRHSAAPMQLIS